MKLVIFIVVNFRGGTFFKTIYWPISRQTRRETVYKWLIATTHSQQITITKLINKILFFLKHSVLTNYFRNKFRLTRSVENFTLFPCHLTLFNQTMNHDPRKSCTACFRSGSITLRYCFDKLVCGSCKGAYYKYFNILVEKMLMSLTLQWSQGTNEDIQTLVEFLLPLLRCNEKQKCSIKSETQVLCRRCRYLISVVVFECKIQWVLNLTKKS